MKEVNIPLSIKDCGVEKDKFEEKVNYLAVKAFEDQCTTANPRLPLIKELEDIYRKAYIG
jgi:acetaldehyde dehydrogenase/alcohol dehydrogenase